MDENKTIKEKHIQLVKENQSIKRLMNKAKEENTLIKQNRSFLIAVNDQTN
jgi:hypothetical protein